MERVPDWMAGVNVEFVCNNCPNRQTKNIAFIQLDTPAPVTAAAAEVDTEEVADTATDEPES
ncbi:MAG TPA: hypothetical protein VM328_09090 [Fimbriimonadaceae bacterium]|nr:hypothetical protein [Fimbriimonadaceae bacterium]